MGALFHNAPLFQHDDAVRLLHRGQAVRNDQGCAFAAVGVHGGVQRRLHHTFTLRIQGAGGFVQQQYRRVLQNGPRNRDALALPAGQAYTPFAQEGVVAFGQVADETVGKCGLGRSQHLGVAGVGASVADVFAGGGREDGRILWHHADVGTQIL